MPFHISFASNAWRLTWRKFVEIPNAHIVHNCVLSLLLTIYSLTTFIETYFTCANDLILALRVDRPPTAKILTKSSDHLDVSRNTMKFHENLFENCTEINNVTSQLYYPYVNFSAYSLCAMRYLIIKNIDFTEIQLTYDIYCALISSWQISEHEKMIKFKHI